MGLCLIDLSNVIILWLKFWVEIIIIMKLDKIVIYNFVIIN